MASEPCQRYIQAAEIVGRAARLLDPVIERRELEEMQRRLVAAGREVHSVCCLPWRRILAPAPEGSDGWETMRAARRITDKATRACYESGHLPLGRLELRARRYAVKLFLAHYHHVLYESMMGTAPPLPFIFTDQARMMGLGDHTHFIGPPNWPMDEA